LASALVIERLGLVGGTGSHERLVMSGAEARASRVVKETARSILCEPGPDVGGERDEGGRGRKSTMAAIQGRNLDNKKGQLNNAVVE